jgi:glycosyltransferase involved in cell wall biosynthesis
MSLRSAATGENPIFSIVIPSFKSAHMIADALESVFTQTYKNYEIIVINDGSPDTALLEDKLLPYRDRIIYIRQENKGPGGARNTGILKSRGEFIAFLDSDDQWLPEHLSDMWELLHKNPALDLAYADAVNFGDLESEGRTVMDTNPSEGLADFESLVLARCSVVGSCVVARRQALLDAGLFDESLAQGEDFDLWARVAYRGGKIDYLQKIHTRRRIHEGNLTGDIISSYLGQATVLKKLMRELAVPDALKEKMRIEIQKCDAEIALERSKQKLVAGEYDEACDELRRANAWYRSRKLQFVLFLLRAAPRLVRRLYLTRNHNGQRTEATRTLRRDIEFTVIGLVIVCHPESLSILHGVF